jgi:hypothetical protein
MHAIVHPVGLDGLQDRVNNALARQTKIKPDLTRTFEQPVKMRIEEDKTPLVKT